MIAQELLLVKIIKIVLYVLPEITLPSKVGRPYVYSPQILMCCFLIMVAKKLSIRGLHSFLVNTEDYQSIIIRLTIPFPEEKIPNRRTFDRRLTRWQLSAQLYMLSAVCYLVEKFKLGISRVSLDNRMFSAFGSIWHRKDQIQGIIPDNLRNVDITAGWGVSAYRKWIFGHALDVFVTTGKLVVPVLAFSRSLVIRGNTAVKRFIGLLPKVKKGVIAADSEYDDSNLEKLAKLTGRSLHTPSKRKPEEIPKSKTYQKRKVTVEPFFERFLLAFVLRGKLDRKGSHAWSYLVTCCFLYQLMVIYNLTTNKINPLEVTHLIRML